MMDREFLCVLLIVCRLWLASCDDRLEVEEQVMSMTINVLDVWFSLNSTDHGFQTGFNFTFTVTNPYNRMMKARCFHTMDDFSLGRLTVQKDGGEVEKIERGEQYTFEAKTFVLTATAGYVNDPEFGCLISIPPDNKDVRKTKLDPISRASQIVPKDQTAPWRVSMYTDDGQQCTGTMISNMTIISTKTCVKTLHHMFIPDDMYYWRTLNVSVKDVNIYLYYRKLEGFDMGLVKLHTAADVGHGLRPISINYAMKPVLNYTSVVQYGSYVESIFMSQRKNECETFKGRSVCLSFPKDMIVNSALQGDTVVTKIGQEYYFTAMFSSRSAKDDRPSWYTDVSPFILWINNIIYNTTIMQCL